MKNKTLQAYNSFPKEFASKFNKSWVRENNIRHAFSFFEDISNLNVLEIGCGNWKDAKEILKYTSNYIWIDYSIWMLELAKEYIPEANFLLVDIKDFESDKKFDIIFSFASLVHLKKDELESILKRLYELLNDDWIIYLSLKYNEQYKEDIVTDELGERFFALYNAKTVKDIKWNFEFIYENVAEVNKRFWLEIILKE